MRWAKGARALAHCMRCGDRVPYGTLVIDESTKGLRVCPSCFDIKHPTEKPFRTDEGIALKNPAPDLDDDSPGDAGQTLAEAMGFTNTFGGGT